MKHRMSSGLLPVGVILPLVLLFWPFVRWGTGLGLVLRVIPAVSLQVWLCKVSKYPWVRLLPMVFTGLFAAWGTHLYFTSAHWSHATVGGLLMDYISPCISCTAVYGIYSLLKRNE